jgi:ABC-2 type transport system permease protein
MFSLSTLSIWMTRAQGLVFAYFNLFNVGRYPDSVFKGSFRRILGVLPPVILVAALPARWLTFPSQSPWSITLELLTGTLACAILTRLLWKIALRSYGSASS